MHLEGVARRRSPGCRAEAGLVDEVGGSWRGCSEACSRRQCRLRRARPVRSKCKAPLVEQLDLFGGQPTAPLDQVGPPAQRPCEGLRPTPPGDAAMVARPQHLGHLPARNSAGRVYCGYSSRPSLNDSSSADASLPITPGHQPAHGLEDRPWPPPRPRRARSRRSTARRRRGVGAPARRRPRSDRTAGENPRRRPARRRSAGRSGDRRAEQESGRGGSAASTAANSGSGISTIPAPPPNGASSTERWGSVVRRAQVVDADVEQRRRSCPAQQALAGEPVDHVGEDREDVDPHAARDARGRGAPRAASITMRPGSYVGHEDNRHQGTAVEHEQIGRGVGLDSLDAAHVGAIDGSHARRRRSDGPTASSSGSSTASARSTVPRSARPPRESTPRRRPRSSPSGEAATTAPSAHPDRSTAREPGSTARDVRSVTSVTMTSPRARAPARSAPPPATTVRAPLVST